VQPVLQSGLADFPNEKVFFNTGLIFNKTVLVPEIVTFSIIFELSGAVLTTNNSLVADGTATVDSNY
jgi:hypothetical protein